MAKLEELVTPLELRDAIRDGALKSEIARKYKTSDQDLAMMLLPLYRSGELTKEEFNDFFNGLSLGHSRDHVEDATSENHIGAKPVDEQPSEILKSVSRLFVRKQAGTAEQPAQPLSEDPPSVDLSHVIESRPDFSPAVDFESGEHQRPQALVQDAEPSGSPEPESVEQVTPAAGLDDGAEPPRAVDSPGATSVLDLIFSKLTSIESRLAEIEKKLGTH